MSFAADRALQAFQGILATPSASERGDLVQRKIDATPKAPPVIVVRRLLTAKDPLEELEARRAELQTVLPQDGTTAVISAALPRRDLSDPYQGGGPGPFGGGLRNADFILTSVRENQNEKYQIFQTFDGYILYSMGVSPSIYTFSGYVINNAKGQGSLRFLQFYRDHLRASAAIQANTTSAVSFLSTIARGYVLAVRIEHRGDSPGASQFSFDMLLV